MRASPWTIQRHLSGLMTAVPEIAKSSNGKPLCNVCEIPALCRGITEEAVDKLRAAILDGPLVIGNTSEPICGGTHGAQ
jgi:repressor of nif and glnA expression